MGKCLYDETLREAADCLNAYVEWENELIELAGFNLQILIDKLRAGYTIEPPAEEKLTPHLLDVTCSDDWGRGIRVYEIGIDVEWDDLTEYEKQKLYESQRYQLNKWAWNKRR